MVRNFISKLWLYITNPRKVKYALCLIRSGYLYERGWFLSLLEKKVITLNRDPYPWLSYPAIDFLKTYLKEDAYIFEYGSGYSTLYYSNRYKFVASVEHNKSWYNKIKSQLEKSNNCELFFSVEKNDFLNAIEKTNKQFDCIIIDGKWGNESAIKALDFLKSDGIIVLDDADRLEYTSAIEFIIKQGFIAIPFIGMSAISYEDHNTMIFIKR